MVSARTSRVTPHALTVTLVTRMLREAFEGPPGPWTYFIDTAPGTGAFGTIGELSAVQASEQGGPNNTTIAAHVHHLSAALALSRQALQSRRTTRTSRDRSMSWSLSTVDDAAWVALRAELRREYDSLVVEVMSHTNWDEDAMGIAFGAIAHAAYHLGAIRQRLTPRGKNR
jgi:hypothetical protein